MNPIRLQIEGYALERMRGHSKDFLFAGMTNKWGGAKTTSVFLKAISRRRPLVPIYRLNPQNTNSGSIAAPGYVEAEYRVVDGELLWIYRATVRRVDFNSSVSEERHDAKEADPTLRGTFEQVNAEVSSSLKKSREG